MRPEILVIFYAVLTAFLAIVFGELVVLALKKRQKQSVDGSAEELEKNVKKLVEESTASCFNTKQMIESLYPRSEKELVCHGNFRD